MKTIDISDEIKAVVYSSTTSSNANLYHLKFVKNIFFSLGFIDLDLTGGKYCYYPAQNIVLPPERMQLIINFLNKLNEELEK